MLCVCVHVDDRHREQMPICQPLCLTVFFHFFISIPLCSSHPSLTFFLYNHFLLFPTTIFSLLPFLHLNSAGNSLIPSRKSLSFSLSMTMTTNNNNNNNNAGLFGDTTLTKVFVGGLAWETPKDSMRDHFEKFGEILEAVIISDKLTGRSKGYGFVSLWNPRVFYSILLFDHDAECDGFGIDSDFVL